MVMNEIKREEGVKPLFEFFKDELMIMKEVDQTLREDFCLFCDQGLFGPNRRRDRHDLRHFLMMWRTERERDNEDQGVKIKRTRGMNE